MHGKHILLGVTGGIAAYKSADLVRRLREHGAHVQVVMTAAAREFITPTTFQALSGRPVRSDLWNWNERPSHVASAVHRSLAPARRSLTWDADGRGSSKTTAGRTFRASSISSRVNGRSADIRPRTARSRRLSAVSTGGDFSDFRTRTSNSSL